MKKFRSSIRTSLMRHVLMKGTAIALIGAFIILFGGALLPLDALERWGWLLFLVGVGFITWGLLPFRRLRRLENTPDEIVIDDSALHYISKERGHISIPLQSIERTAYVERSYEYGIAIWLKEPIAASKGIYGCDLFLPYFSERAYTELHDILTCP